MSEIPTKTSTTVNNFETVVGGVRSPKPTVVDAAAKSNESTQVQPSRIGCHGTAVTTPATGPTAPMMSGIGRSTKPRHDWSVLGQVRRVALMIPPTITERMMLPMIEILIGEPMSANTILMPISTAMNTRNLCIGPAGTGLSRPRRDRPMPAPPERAPWASSRATECHRRRSCC